jgi:glycerol-3-phosphate dehydrogenase
VNVFLDVDWASSSSLSVSAPGERAPVLFLHPWKGGVLAGTLHRPWSGAIPTVLDEQLVEELLQELREAVPGLTIGREHVVRAHWGLLPGTREGSADLLRRGAVLDHSEGDGPAGLVSATAVKFTTARRVALNALKCAGLGDHRVRPSTAPPRVRRLPESRDFLMLSESDPPAAAEMTRRVIEEEAVACLPDLLVRRTSWGMRPETGAAVAEQLRAVGVHLPERPDARADQATAMPISEGTAHE